jgi:hypothetical protein
MNVRAQFCGSIVHKISKRVLCDFPYFIALIFIYCRNQSTVTKIITLHISHCLEQEIIFLNFIQIYTPYKNIWNNVVGLDEVYILLHILNSLYHELFSRKRSDAPTFSPKFSVYVYYQILSKYFKVFRRPDYASILHLLHMESKTKLINF